MYSRSAIHNKAQIFITSFCEWGYKLRILKSAVCKWIHPKFCSFDEAWKEYYIYKCIEFQATWNLILYFFLQRFIRSKPDRIYPSGNYQTRSQSWGSVCPFCWLCCKIWLPTLQQGTAELLFRDRHGWPGSRGHELFMCRFRVVRIIQNPILPSKIEL